MLKTLLYMIKNILNPKDSISFLTPNFSLVTRNIFLYQKFFFHIMATESLPCAYHPDKEATTKCFRCNKNICIDDKILYDDNTYDYGMIRDSCIPCYAILTEKDFEGKFSFYVSIFFLIVWILVTTLIFWPLLIISVALVYIIVNSRKQKRQAVEDSKVRLNEFFETLDPKQKQIFHSIYDISCAQCGTVLNPSDIYCRTCGDVLD